ncbi:toll/interleukin-1 receptor domain-containing protein [Tardiphaga sp. 768_D3_N2_1]|uniref:toll/interleukin-1 receptor domain-containing protein n=1 Tax=Tardiphaga sp. 768_D3_N2_1 TaxID=3240783 RepID=UPI003F8AC91E
MPKRFDAFISHASEDKETFVRPLAEFLKNAGVEIWYDEFSLKVGDSLSRSIDKGLSRSKFGVVVLSEAFLKKRWTEYELSGLVAKEINGRKSIVPVWLNISKKDVIKFSPTLADKFSLMADKSSIEAVAFKIIEIVKPELFSRVNQRLAVMEISRSGRAADVDINAIKLAPLRHAKLSSELTSRIRLIRAALLEVKPTSMAAWVDGFRRDTTPETEVAIWERIASIYLEHSYGKPKSVRKNIYEEVLRFVNFGRLEGVSDEIFKRASSLSPIEGKEVERYSISSENMLATDEEEMKLSNKKSSVTHGVPSEVLVKLRIDELSVMAKANALVKVDIFELQHEEVRKILAEAGALIGRDKRTGGHAIFYGRETLNEFSRRNDKVAFPRPIVEISYDNSSDQLEFLIAAVITLKGGCCYGDCSD